MGTGKSLVAIALWKAFQFRRVLIITGTKAMVDEWPDMVDAETGGTLAAYALKGSLTDRAAWLKSTYPVCVSERPSAIVVNVEAVWQGRLGMVIESIPWDCIIFDESQKIKSAGAKASRFCHLLAKRWNPYRLAMTGTPLHDKPLDIYGQYRFLDDRIFGTNFESFKARYTIQKQVKPNVYIVVGYKNEDELSNKISSISFSVDESVVKLPAVVEPDPIMVDLCPVARKAYRDMEKELVVDFGDAIGSTIAGSDLSAYVRLQQITSGFLPAP
jgi:hypothetical protein